MKDIKKVTLIGLGAMGVFLRRVFQKNLGLISESSRMVQEKSAWSEKV